MRALTFVLLTLVTPVTLTTTACSPRYAAYPTTSKDATERIVQARATIAIQRTSPFASEAMLDLNRADSLLGAAEKRAADPETVDEFLDLLLSTVEGQLSLVSTYYSRRKAETTLDARRSVSADSQADTSRVGSDAKPSKRTNP